jgi:hypothetical protein
LEFGISSYINFQQLIWSLNGEILGSIFTIHGILMTTLIIPSLMMWIICAKDKYDLGKKSFQKMFGVLY